MFRATFAAFLSLAIFAPAIYAQDGALNRIGRGLDQTGKNIRSTVETEVARGQISAEERDILNRVGKRIDWDKKMAGSTLRVEVQPGGIVILQGSVMSEAARLRAVDLVENTTGVTSVVDQLAVVKATRVIEAPRDARVIESRKAAPIVQGTAPVIVVPSESKIIVKP